MAFDFIQFTSRITTEKVNYFVQNNSHLQGQHLINIRVPIIHSQTRGKGVEKECLKCRVIVN